MAQKTRIAPTPSGFLHIGNAFSMALAYLWARSRQMELWLRIDDLDQQRYRPHFADDIFQTLELLGIEWDEGPRHRRDLENNWSQNHRLPLYEKALEELRHSDQLFTCECSRKKLATASEESGYPGFCRDTPQHWEARQTAWRLRTDPPYAISFYDLSGRVHDANLPPEMRDFVLRRKDGLPAYQLASLVDDEYFGFQHLVRGADLFPSSLAQLYLARLRGSAFANVRLGHHQLVEKQPGKKLSKSQKAPALRPILEDPQQRGAFFKWLSAALGFAEAQPSLKAMVQNLHRDAQAGQRQLEELLSETSTGAPRQSTPGQN